MTEQRRSKTRGYRMVGRRDSLDAMRRRITEAAFELHGTVGPAKTTIKAVAERAGVQRHTVYNHFPDMASLIRACTEHGMRTTGIPSPEAWQAITDPAARLERGLDEMYAFYRSNSSLLKNVLRDIGMMAQVGGVEPLLERMGELFGALAEGWPGDGRSQQLRAAAIAHAMAYDTWRSFADHEVADADIRALMVRLVTGISQGLEPAQT